MNKTDYNYFIETLRQFLLKNGKNHNHPTFKYLEELYHIKDLEEIRMNDNNDLMYGVKSTYSNIMPLDKLYDKFDKVERLFKSEGFIEDLEKLMSDDDLI